MSVEWYCRVAGTEYGPLSGGELVDMARGGRLTSVDFVRKANEQDWRPAAEVRGLPFPAIAPTTAVPRGKRAARIEKAYRGCVVTLLIQLAALILLVLAVLVEQLADDEATAVRLLAIAGIVGASVVLLAAMVAEAVYFLMLLYRCWDTVQDDDARLAPGMAVGLLFVPFFSLYWIVLVTCGLAHDLNRVAEKRGLAAQASVPAMRWFVATVWLAAIPGLGLPMLIPQAVCRMWAMRSAKDVAKAIAG